MIFFFYNFSFNFIKGLINFVGFFYICVSYSL